MELTHLVLWANRKDTSSYSILFSLYEASDENSLVRFYLSIPEVLLSLRVFAKTPSLFKEIRDGIDAQLYLQQDLTTKYLRLSTLLGSEQQRKHVCHYTTLILSDICKRQCLAKKTSPFLVKAFREMLDYKFWSHHENIPEIIGVEVFSYQGLKHIFDTDEGFQLIRGYFIWCLSNKVNLYCDFDCLCLKRLNELIDFLETEEQLLLFVRSKYFRDYKQVRMKANELDCERKILTEIRDTMNISGRTTGTS